MKRKVLTMQVDMAVTRIERGMFHFTGHSPVPSGMNRVRIDLETDDAGVEVLRDLLFPRPWTELPKLAKLAAALRSLDDLVRAGRELVGRK